MWNKQAKTDKSLHRCTMCQLKRRSLEGGTNMTHEKYTNIFNKEWQIQIEETEISTEWFHSLDSKIPKETGNSVSVIC